MSTRTIPHDPVAPGRCVIGGFPASRDQYESAEINSLPERVESI
jgi:hypothetical protein